MLASRTVVTLQDSMQLDSADMVGCAASDRWPFLQQHLSGEAVSLRNFADIMQVRMHIVGMTQSYVCSSISNSGVECWRREKPRGIGYFDILSPSKGRGRVV